MILIIGNPSVGIESLIRSISSHALIVFEPIKIDAPPEIKLKSSHIKFPKIEEYSKRNSEPYYEKFYKNKRR